MPMVVYYMDRNWINNGLSIAIYCYFVCFVLETRRCMFFSEQTFPNDIHVSFFLNYRIVDKSFKEGHSLITKVYLTARPIIMLREGPCVQDVINRLQVSIRLFLYIQSFFQGDSLTVDYCFRSLHNCNVPEVSSRTFCMRVLLKTIEQRYFQRTEW